MSKNKSLLLGFSIGAFALVLITASILGIVFSTNTQGVRADTNSIFGFSADAIIDTSFKYDEKHSEAYPTTTFYAIVSDTDGTIVEVAKCDFGKKKITTIMDGALEANHEYTVNIIGPTFLDIKSTINGTGSTSSTVENLQAKTFSFVYASGMTINFTVVRILDDSWFTDFR